ncbi:MAG: hypothetical protein KDK27_01830 [Leptospiraceae bacterium]|nr:hypothetical protein [Leptospiraceae bacterium]
MRRLSVWLLVVFSLITVIQVFGTVFLLFDYSDLNTPAILTRVCVFLLIAFCMNAFLAYVISVRMREPLRNITRRINSFPGGRSLYIQRSTYSEALQLTRELDDFLRRISTDLNDLRLEKELLAELLEGLREGVLCINKNGLIVYQNSAVHAGLVEKNMNGRPYFAAIRNSKLLEYVHQIFGEKFENNLDTNRSRNAEPDTNRMRNADSANRPGSEIAFGNIELTQSGRSFRVSAYPVLMGGDPELYLLLISDQTQQITTQRLREDFLQNASHELKTPITSIRGYAETMLFRESRPQPRGFLEGIIRNVERMERIIEDMVMISSLESRSFPFHPEDVPIKKFMTNIRKLVSGSLKQKFQNLEIELPDEDLSLRADPLLLEHLLLNLIVNASRYSPEETAIRVQLEREPGRIVFSIADSGPGIPSDLRTKIFERFFRVDKDRSRSQGGTGLGLSIVRQISRLHGGRVWVEANPAGGSVFRVSLPL